MSELFERRGFREAVRAEVAEVVTAEELVAFNSTGDPNCCFETEVFVAAPLIRMVKERGHRWYGRSSARNHSARGDAQRSLAEDETTVASPQDIRDRYNNQLSRCVQLGNEGGLTHAWRKFRQRHLPEIWELEETAIRGFSSGQTA